MNAARRHGTIVSYDLNYRPSLWKAIGGKQRAQEVNRAIAPLVDVMIGNEEDFSACLGFETGTDESLLELDVESYRAMIESVTAEFPNLDGRGHHLADRPQRHRERLDGDRVVTRDRSRAVG